MEGLEQYLIPYIVSQIVALMILIAAWKNTRIARMLFALVFLYAGCYNMYIGFVKPDEYLDFSRFALPFYKNFISGLFSQYNHIIIPVIATGQLLIAIGMVFKDWWVRWACIGAIAFLVSITPLMLGSAFPFTLIVSIAAYMILINDEHKYLWLKGLVKTNATKKI